ncbi:MULTISPECIES: hypothetical protein [Erysipelotrichaceae]|uniref:hypothetical protein n=1 Tax=Erysipelotrichaceae TaxID=128827 RepID=UPI000E3F3570|nr:MULTISPECIES: hypothetical protein [unclassified Absiella]RGB64301.1 hypothetical protein DW113_15765 [Absiella sp. AM09-45]RGB73054.1 hypothetical protein DW114_17140 [Absiella sp. AM09-50]RGC16421.1 hypothetical protein DXA09_18450 [Absiella sp. AM54-8XD]RHU01587.1 hypothetical protein DW716_17750 [Absiella sp. AM27-20]
MKKYKDDLNHFKLDEQQIAQLKYQVKTNQTVKKRRKKIYLPVGIVIITAILIIFLIPKPHVSYGAITYLPNIPQIEKKTYTPQSYDWLGGGIFDSLFDKNRKDVYDNTYEDIKALPVYRYQNVDLQAAEIGDFEDNVLKERMQLVKEQLQMEGQIQSSNDYDVRYHLEDDEKNVSVYRDASIHIQYKQEIERSTISNSEKMLQLAKQYQSVYAQTRKITSPIYHVIETGPDALEVLITQKSENAPIYAEGKDAIHFTIIDTLEAAYPCIVLPYQKNIEEVDTMPLISKEEAEEKLLQGDYYYFFHHTEFTKEDIIGYDLLYPTLKRIRTFLPYRLPVYRFYILKAEGIYFCDVVAITSDAYERLTDMNPYTKQKP